MRNGKCGVTYIDVTLSQSSSGEDPVSCSCLWTFVGWSNSMFKSRLVWNGMFICISMCMTLAVGMSNSTRWTIVWLVTWTFSCVKQPMACTTQRVVTRTCTWAYRLLWSSSRTHEIFYSCVLIVARWPNLRESSENIIWLRGCSSRLNPKQLNDEPIYSIEHFMSSKD